jgi:hypothetical protein
MLVGMQSTETTLATDDACPGAFQIDVRLRAPQARPIAMAVAMTLLAMPTAALAECDNIAPASGTSVNCTGSITAPARADVGATNVSINIAPGASGSFVNAVNPVAMRVDSGSSVSNGGSCR